MNIQINKIYNKDCFEMLKGFKDEVVDCIITDPPYGINFKSNHRNISYNKLSNDNNLLWLEPFLKDCHRILKKDSHMYIFCSFHNLDKFMIEVKKVFKLKNILVWKKNNWSMGDLKGDYAPQYEFILFLTKGKKKLNGRRDSNILEFSRTNNKIHPTQKPLDLIEFLISKSTNEYDLILDPFNGSGSTTLSCMKMNRNFIGIEIDENYFNISKNRLDNYSKGGKYE